MMRLLVLSVAFAGLNAPSQVQDTHKYQRQFGNVNLTCPERTSPRLDCTFSLAKRAEGDKGQNLFFWGSFGTGVPRMGISYLAAPGEANDNKRGIALRVRGDAGGDRTVSFECTNTGDPECNSAVVNIDADEFASSGELTVTAIADGQPRLNFTVPVNGLREAFDAAANPDQR